MTDPAHLRRDVCSGMRISGEVPSVAVFAGVNRQEDTLFSPQDFRPPLCISTTSVRLLLLPVRARAVRTLLARGYPFLRREMPFAAYTAGIGHEAAAVRLIRVYRTILSFFQRIILC